MFMLRPMYIFVLAFRLVKSTGTNLSLLDVSISVQNGGRITQFRMKARTIG